LTAEALKKLFRATIRKIELVTGEERLIMQPAAATTISRSENAKIEVVKASYEAFIAKDRVAIEALIADDFHFTSPLDNRIDRATYFDRCWPLSKRIESFEFMKVAASGNRVFVTYVGRMDGNSFQNTEIATVREGEIVKVEVYIGWSIPHRAKLGGFIAM